MFPVPVPRVARLLIVVPALAAMTAPARSQVTVVDAGTFSLRAGGVRVGREDFSIRRTLGTADGAFVAQGNVLFREKRLAVALNTDSAGTPLRFRLETFTAGQSTENVTGEWRRGLWSGRAVHARGESAREFRLPAGTIAVEDGVVHQLWFLLRFGGGLSARVLVPGSLTMREVRVEDAGPDSVLIANQQLQARKWVIRAGSSDAPEREVWTDSGGRLLRVTAPAESLEALRDEPPAETPPAAAAYGVSEPTHIGLRLDAIAVVCAPDSRRRDADDGPDTDAGDPLLARGVGHREGEQPDLPAIRDGSHARLRSGPDGLRSTAAERGCGIRRELS